MLFGAISNTVYLSQCRTRQLAIQPDRSVLIDKLDPATGLLEARHDAPDLMAALDLCEILDALTQVAA